MKRTARQIDVNPIGDRNYAVVVDGLLWCYAIREPRGMHGASYQIQYSRHDEPVKENGSDVVLWSDRHWLSSQGFHGSAGMAKHRAVYEGKYKSIQQRIEEAVARLIKKKLVISPTEREQRREAQAAVNLKRREEFEAAARKRLETEARKAVREMRLPDCGSSDKDRFVARIVEAMEWARSHT